MANLRLPLALARREQVRAAAAKTIAALDRNRDQKISISEAKRSAELMKIFREVDTDKDLNLTAAEMQEYLRRKKAAAKN